MGEYCASIWKEEGAGSWANPVHTYWRPYDEAQDIFLRRGSGHGDPYPIAGSLFRHSHLAKDTIVTELVDSRFQTKGSINYR